MTRDDTGMSEGEYQAMTDEIYGGREPWVWVTRDGRSVPISEMEDSHLVNTIRFLRRNVDRYRVAELSRMGAYVLHAPDGAAMACESEANFLMDLKDDAYLQHRFPVFRTMLGEATKRKLSL